MRLREKTLLIIGGTILGGVVLFLLLSPNLLLEGFSRLEQANAQASVERALLALDNEREGLDRSLHDWASWDETYRFAKDQNPRYVQDNLVDATLERLDIGFVLFLSPRSELLYEQLYQNEARLHQSFPPDLVEAIRSTPLIKRVEENGSHGCYFDWQGQPWLLIARPILTSLEQDPPRGFLVFGRPLDGAHLQRLADQTQLNLSLQGPSARIEGKPAPLNVKGSIPAPIAIEIQPDSILGIGQLPDLLGQPGLSLQVELPRTALEQGKDSQTVVIVALVAFGILLAAVLAWLLTRNVTGPVARLSRSVRALGQSGSLDARIQPSRESAELASLAGEINGMLDAVQATQDMREEEETRYHAVIEQIADCILLVDPANKRLLEGNRAFWKLMGGEEDPPAWITLYEILPLEVSAVDELIGQVLAKRSAFLADQPFRRLDGSQVEVEVSVSLLQMGGQEVLCLVARDLTPRKEAAARIEQMTFFDPLTGLPNRLYLREWLGRSIEAARQTQTYLALLLVDLDYFRNVNETLGHQAGDRLLTQVAERLQRQLEEGELARLGGDTFSLLLPSLTSPAEALKAAEGVQEILRAPFSLNNEELTITSSIGIALFPNDAADPETLLKYADSALHQAKAQGRNHSQFFRPAMNLEVTQFVELRNQLLHAIEREELSIHYQPQADRQGRLAGAEALLRWQHPTLGQISPERFIPLAEETGLIVPIGEWVLQTVASQIRRWQREGRNPVRISINLSARQLQQPQVLLEQVSQALKHSGLDGSSMGLEITESLALRDLEVNLRTLGTLRAMGLALSLDDFGTGYSAFSYLPRFPIAAIKIDRSFVSPKDGEAPNPALLAGMVQIAHGFNLIVIAEGVEKPEQLQALLAMGCDGFQGMLLSPPLAVDQFGQLLSQGGCWPGFNA